MTESVVYLLRWDHSDRFQWLAYDLPENEISDDLMWFKGQPKWDIWELPPVYSPHPRRERPDIWHLAQAGSVLVVSDEVVDVLGSFVHMAGELLPLAVSGTNDLLYALNILNDIDCLDTAKEPKDLLQLYPHFLDHRLPESGVFKIPQLDTTDIFYVERDDDEESLIELIERHDLKGIWFERVWSSSGGAEPLNLMFDDPR